MKYWWEKRWWEKTLESYGWENSGRLFAAWTLISVLSIGRAICLWGPGRRSFMIAIACTGYVMIGLYSWYRARSDDGVPFPWEVQKLREFRKRQRGLCPKCGYDLRATPLRCPECGYEPELLLDDTAGRK